MISSNDTVMNATSMQIMRGHFTITYDRNGKVYSRQRHASPEAPEALRIRKYVIDFDAARAAGSSVRIAGI